MKNAIYFNYRGQLIYIGHPRPYTAHPHSYTPLLCSYAQLPHSYTRFCIRTPRFRVRTPCVHVHTPHIQVNTPYVHVRTPRVHIHKPHACIHTPCVSFMYHPSHILSQALCPHLDPFIHGLRCLRTSKRTSRVRLRALWTLFTSQCMPDELPRPWVSMLVCI